MSNVQQIYAWDPPFAFLFHFVRDAACIRNEATLKCEAMGFWEDYIMTHDTKGSCAVRRLEVLVQQLTSAKLQVEKQAIVCGGTVYDVQVRFPVWFNHVLSDQIQFVFGLLQSQGMLCSLLTCSLCQRRQVYSCDNGRSHHILCNLQAKADVEVLAGSSVPGKVRIS